VATWTIGEAAAKCGLSPHTLRWYERIGLLGSIQRGGDGRRRYGDGDLEWLSLLTKLRATAALYATQAREHGPVAALHLTGLVLTAIALAGALAAVALPRVRNTALVRLPR
jgi:hypothetical protein